MGLFNPKLSILAPNLGGRGAGKQSPGVPGSGWTLALPLSLSLGLFTYRAGQYERLVFRVVVRIKWDDFCKDLSTAPAHGEDALEPVPLKWTSESSTDSTPVTRTQSARLPPTPCPQIFCRVPRHPGNAVCQTLPHLAKVYDFINSFGVFCFFFNVVKK